MFQTILTPLDLEESSQAGLQAAAELARSTGGKLVAVAVLTGGDISAELASHEVPHRRAQLETIANQKLDRILAAGASGVEVERILTFGDPVTEIHAAADQVGADVIVITVKNRSRVGKLLMGSKAQEIILSSTRPVLTIPRA